MFQDFGITLHIPLNRLCPPVSRVANRTRVFCEIKRFRSQIGGSSCYVLDCCLLINLVGLTMCFGSKTLFMRIVRYSNLIHMLCVVSICKLSISQVLKRLVETVDNLLQRNWSVCYIRVPYMQNRTWLENGRDRCNKTIYPRHSIY